MSQSLVVAGKPLSIGTFNGAITDKQTLVGARNYIATKGGVIIEKGTKDNPGPTMKEVKELVKLQGFTDADIKAWSKEYDKARSEYYTQSGLVNGLLAADPTLRKAVKLSRNKDGVVIGAVTTYRRERGVNATLQAKVEELTKALAAATAKLPAPATA